MRIPTNLGVPGSALRPSSFGGPFASFGQGQNPTSFIDTILQKERERMQAQADKAYQKAIELQKQSAMLEPPKMGGAIGKQDLLPMLLLAGIAKALGAQDRDLAEGLGGFVQGRQGVAQTNYQNDTARYDAERQRAEMDAKIAAMEADRQQGAADRFGGRLDKYEQRGWDAKQAEAADQRDYEREKLRQDALTGRAELSSEDKAKTARNTILKTILPYATTPEERNKLIDWAANMRPDELQIVAGLSDAEVLQRARAKTEDAMRGPKVEKVKAEVEKILTGAIKDKAATDLYRARVAQYPLESQARIANIYSQIENRSKSGPPKGEKYYGQGLEAAMRQLLRISEDTIANWPAHTQAEAEAARQDREYAKSELAKIEASKAEYGKTEMNRRHGGGSRPRSEIDTSGGFGPVAPVVLGVTDSPFAGARAAAGAQRPKTKPKPKPKATPKTNKTRSGTSYEFIPD